MASAVRRTSASTFAENTSLAVAVPAATAANLSRNMRQLFWWSIGLCLLAGVAGQWLSWEVMVATSRGTPVHPGESGSIVVVSVVLFFLSMAVGPWLKSRRPAHALARVEASSNR